MFWNWLLKYSPFLITGAVSFVVAYVIYLITNKSPDLIYYASHPTTVILPAQPGQQAVPPITTFTLFLWNQGRAAAKEVHVGHYQLPAHNVFPDIPRDEAQTPGGGYAIRFPVVPPKVLVAISYLAFGATPVSSIVSYVGFEGGAAKYIPVMLQRIWPKSVLVMLQMLLVAGLWVAINAVWSLAKFLWLAYYLK